MDKAMLSFLSSNAGRVLALGLMVFLFVGGAGLLMLIRATLPPGNPIRERAEAWVASIKQNPRRFFQPLAYLMFGLLVLAIVAITLMYS